MRTTTVFEKMLLIVGLAVAFLGFYMINLAYKTGEGLTWLMIVAIFSWLTLLVLFIVSGLNADIKEELVAVIRDHIDETRLLKEISHELLEEIRMLRLASKVTVNVKKEGARKR
ncbi:hypothetical protein COT48_00675 [Candidatus Woesearchaeota archaeon CG08_land_8_20_14_0_20_47_9]|nr:MAG: hypothetical protein COT48_00675 [Candidatus Woesearchaeota archaeon CG08_land_8_20_14_0_20_47_9]HII30069.1 hypothetical protein [Candidatus Woesearchaeota archaeon]